METSSIAHDTTSGPSTPISMMNPAPVSTTVAQGSTDSDFHFPPHYSFPPFFTLQPNLVTLSRQLSLWSSLIQSYCAHNRIFRISLTQVASTPLFQNATLNRRLDILSVRRVIDYMVTAEGDRRAEWVLAGRKSRDANENKSSAWVYWRRPEEWADAIHAWVEETGQKGSVLTVYELRESDAVQGQAWIGMDEELFRRCLDLLVKRGKAQIFGADESAGIKFF